MLPTLELIDKTGAMHTLPELPLTLAPAGLGLSPRTGRSWTDRVTGLLEHYGPFGLAYLEALVRAADVRASTDPNLADPAFAQRKAE
jgi:CRISPR-associated endonuclease/helicase Cas3